MDRAAGTMLTYIQAIVAALEPPTTKEGNKREKKKGKSCTVL